MNAEIISIGTELLLGHVVNTNTAFLSRGLSEIGIDVYNTSVVGDNPGRLTQSLRQASRRADIIITIGGLGPTVDDITKETVVSFAQNAFARPIRNKVGSASGYIMENKDNTIICLPGPPREIEPMFVNEVASYLIRKFRLRKIIKSRTIKITGLPESTVDKKVRDLLSLKPPTTVGIYAKLGEVDLKIMSKAANFRKAEREIRKIEKKIRRRLNGYIFGCDEETLESAVGAILKRKDKTMAVAESCTGGLLSDRITDVSGSSKYFMMGITAYTNEVKKNILCVDGETLARFGAVSRQVASEMAVGIRLLAGTDIGVAITGIAGPTGATKSKPVGLVYIALALGRKVIVRQFRFRGTREEIKFQASQAALDLARKEIN